MKGEEIKNLIETERKKITSSQDEINRLQSLCKHDGGYYIALLDYRSSFKFCIYCDENMGEATIEE